MLEEREYRDIVAALFKRMEQAFESVDPDLVECENANGAVTLLFRQKADARCILSLQPSVRQIWLAIASQGKAYHFSYDANQKNWYDDKGKGIELLAEVKNVVRELTGIQVKL